MTEDIVTRLRDISPGPSDALSELGDEAADEIERLRAALLEIVASPNEIRDATPSDYARGFNDGRWRMQQIARAALAGEKKDV